MLDKMDMWYVSAEFESNLSVEALNFQNIAIGLTADNVLKDPTQGLIIETKGINGASASEKFLVLGLSKSILFLRVVSHETADFVDRKLLEPWKEIDNSSFYENELRNEMGFFHPLFWKKFRAIAALVVHKLFCKNSS
jgi:hypothetical protein